MGLFDEQVAQLAELLEGWRASGAAVESSPGERPLLPAGSTMVLRDETALELGNPGGASLSFILWTGDEPVVDGRVTLVGPDIAEARESGAKSLPFAQVVLASGAFENEYDSYRDIRDAVYDTRLEGFSVRAMPSRQSIWCRVASRAADSGFSLMDVGQAIIASLLELEEVSAAEILFVTSSAEDVRALAATAAGAQRIVDAMMKMYQEANYDCETCEYQDVCDTVMDLKKMRSRLEEGETAG